MTILTLKVEQTLKENGHLLLLLLVLDLAQKCLLCLPWQGMLPESLSSSADSIIRSQGMEWPFLKSLLAWPSCLVRFRRRRRRQYVRTCMYSRSSYNPSLKRQQRSLSLNKYKVVVLVGLGSKLNCKLLIIQFPFRLGNIETLIRIWLFFSKELTINLCCYQMGGWRVKMGWVTMAGGVKLRNPPMSKFNASITKKTMTTKQLMRKKGLEVSELCNSNWSARQGWQKWLLPGVALTRAAAATVTALLLQHPVPPFVVSKWVLEFSTDRPSEPKISQTHTAVVRGARGTHWHWSLQLSRGNPDSCNVTTIIAQRRSTKFCQPAGQSFLAKVGDFWPLFKRFGMKNGSKGGESLETTLTARPKQRSWRSQTDKDEENYLERGKIFSCRLWRVPIISQASRFH